MEEAEIIEKFGVDSKKYESEQRTIAKLVNKEDYMDFENAQFFGGVDVSTIGKEIVASITILDSSFEIIEQKYSKEKARFPYIPSFRAFRELPVIINAYKKLETLPDVMFVLGHGVLHQRECGIATHLGIAVDCATISISKELINGEVKGEEIFINKKIGGKYVETKKSSKPIIVSIGHKVSLNTAVELTLKQIKAPHKLPEPINLSHKFANNIKSEIKKN